MTRKKEECMVCAAALDYLEQPRTLSCHYCGSENRSPIACPQGHFVCDACHSADTLELLRQLAVRTIGESPEEILEELLRLPGLPMHGPEHHPMAGLALLLAAQKAGRHLAEQDIAEMIRRGMQIPGGACGYLGACGAGVGVGAAVSLLCGATPLRGAERTLAHRATGFALRQLADNQPRCCKRCLRLSVDAGRFFLARELGLTLPVPDAATTCGEEQRNRECAQMRCPYFRRDEP